MAEQKTSVDDYYAQIGSNSGADSADSKKPSKIKIKKKVESAEGSEIASEPVKEVIVAPITPARVSAPIVESTPIEKKTDDRRPKISFTPAEKPKPFEPVARTERPAARPDHRQQAPRNDRRPEQRRTETPRTEQPREPRPERNTGPAPRPYVPTPQQQPDKRRSTRPLISFEKPAPYTPISRAEPSTNAPATDANKPKLPPKEHRLKSYSRQKTETKPGTRAEQEAERRRSIKLRGGEAGEDDRGGFRRAKKSGATQPKKQEKRVEDIQQVLVDRTGQEVSIPEVLTVKELSEKLGTPMGKIMAELMKNGMLVNLNTRIDFDTSFLIAEAFGITAKRAEQAGVSSMDILDGDVSELIKEDDATLLVDRPPVISIMGHVDHGKTSILDHIRSATVAASEEGGITQKIGAYQVEKNGRKITFLDTPGHAAFGLMRSRGSKLTDIIIIVVAADEGVKPQTIESIELAKAAEVPVIVAINKMDKEGANPDVVKGQLAEHGLIPEDWGGTTVMMPVSAKTGLGMENLLDMILLVADMQELKANPDRMGVATVIEARLDPKLGQVATVLINTGTLRKGDAVVCSEAYGRIRSLRDFRMKSVDAIGPSTPAIITGLSGAVEGGDILQVVADLPTAERKAHEFGILKATKSIRTFEGASLDLMLGRLKSGNLKQLKIVLKADTNGSLEALRGALQHCATPETQINIIHAGVGDVNDNDVYMAGMSQALLVAYNVSVNPQARRTLEESKIEFINKKVIYHILEKIEAIVTGMIDIRYDDVDLGTAVVKAIFYDSKSKLIIGLGIQDGRMENRAKVRIIRDKKKIGMGEILNLKSGLLDVPRIEAPEECGINLKTDVKIQEGDVLEAYALVERKS